ncbi:MAG: GGDEF domain-containing protein [Dehalococcoidia bacterium]
MQDDQRIGDGEEARHSLDLTERGMSAVQDMLGVLRDADREIVALTRRVRQLEQLAWSDEATGLPNRRGLEDQIQREEARALRYGAPAAIALLDIDAAGDIGRAYGRGAGDTVLRAVAAAMHAAARGSDLVARYEGTTFAALLPGADLAGAQVFVERVRITAQFARLPSGDVIPIVIIAGVATREEAGSLRAALDLADQRLLLNRPRRGA